MLSPRHWRFPLRFGTWLAGGWIDRSRGASTCFSGLSRPFSELEKTKFSNHCEAFLLTGTRGSSLNNRVSIPLRGVYVRGDHMRLKSCVCGTLLAAWPWLLYPLVANTILPTHSSCASEHHYLPRMVVEAIVSRRSSAKKGSSAKRRQSRWCSSPVWIPFYHILVVLLMTFIATNPFPNHITMFVAHAAVAAEPDMDVGALDRRVDAARRLFEGSDPTTGEAELRGMAERYPSYAQAPFYLGLLSQTRGDPEAAMSFYVATLRAGKARFLWLWTGYEVLAYFQYEMYCCSTLFLYRACPCWDIYECTNLSG